MRDPFSLCEKILPAARDIRLIAVVSGDPLCSGRHGRHHQRPGHGYQVRHRAEVSLEDARSGALVPQHLMDLRPMPPVHHRDRKHPSLHWHRPCPEPSPIMAVHWILLSSNQPAFRHTLRREPLPETTVETLGLDRACTTSPVRFARPPPQPVTPA